ncbi:MAG: peptidylprolyl isomerase [Phycisphaerales bacterium JB043]
MRNNSIAMCLLVCVVQGCSSGPKNTSGQTPTRGSGRDVVALIDDTPVRRGDIAAQLSEAAGAQVLEEIVLDTALQKRARARGISIDQDALDREHARLVESLREQVGPDSSWTSAALIGELRRARGLGDVRYNALLTRTALLRALSRDETTITEADVRLAYERTHGTRYDISLITTDDEISGRSALTRLKQGEPFAEVAARLSTHTSGPRGGAIGVITTGDTAVPSVIRETLATLGDTGVSGLLALDVGFAIVRVERVIPGDGTPIDDVRDALEMEAREQEIERRMAQMARQILRQARVTTLDPSLEWSWDNRER